MPSVPERRESHLIVVTGASGYVGSHLVRRLAGRNDRVRAVVHDIESTRKHERLGGLDLELVEADVTRPESLGPAFEGARAIVHTVAIAVEKSEGAYERVNYQGTVHVVDAAEAAGVQRFINISQLGASSEVPYRFLASKGKAQEYVARSRLDWTALRPSAIWGPEDEFANTFARMAPLSPLVYPIVGDGQSQFQPVWVEDVVTSILGCLDDPETRGQELELGGPEVLTLEQIERRTLEAVGARRWLIHVPLPIMRVLVGLMERLLPASPVTGSLLELLAVNNVTTSNATPRFAPEPRPFTVENIAPYMREFRVRDTLARYFGRK